MYGIIRSSRNYSDGLSSFEVWIYFDENEIFHFIIGQRFECILSVGDEQYICGVRSTEDAGSWISPDIYSITNSSEKLRLSELLIRKGFEKNEEVTLLYTPENKKLIIEKK